MTNLSATDLDALTGLEEFRESTASTTRAIAREPEIEVEFVSDSPSLGGKTLRLRRPSPSLPYQEVCTLRGQADSVALRHRYHDDGVHNRLSPRDAGARAVFNALEQARCEALGATRMAGVAGNLDSALEERYRTQGFAEYTEREQAPLAEMVRLLAREAMTGHPPPPAATRVFELWRPQLESQVGAHLRQLRSCTKDQREFAGVLRGLLKDLGFPEEAQDYEHDPDDSENDEDDSSSALNEGEAGDAEAGSPESMEGLEMRDAAEDEMGDAAEATDQLDPSSMDFGADDSEVPGEAAYPPEFGKNDPDRFVYHAYCTDFDEVIAADDLCEAEELARLRQNPRSAARTPAERHRTAREPTATSLARQADPRLGVRPRGRHARQRQAHSNHRQSDVLPVLQAGEGDALSRHRGQSADRQLGLDARAPHRGGGNQRRHPRPHPGTLRGEGGGPRLHHPGLEGRANRANAGSGRASVPTREGSTIFATSSTNRQTHLGGERERTSASCCAKAFSRRTSTARR